MPAATPACPVQVALPHQPFGELLPPGKVVLGQRGLRVVSTRCSVSTDHPPARETAQGQFPNPIPSRVAEGGQLASTAKYIRERINGHSPVCKEFNSRAPKGPPDKAEAGPEGPRLPVDVIAKEIGAGILSSPVLTHEHIDKPSRLDAEGVRRRLVQGRARVPSRLSPGAVSAPLRLTFGVPGMGEKGEGQRACVAVISKISERRAAARVPKGTVPLVLPAATSACPAQTASPHQSLIKPLPPEEVVSGRCGLHVISVRLSTSVKHLPMKETAQKQPLSAMVLLEEGQLTRAATYIQERIYRRSLSCEEFGHRAPKGPPNRIKATAATQPPGDFSSTLPVQAIASHPSFDETLPLVGLALGQRGPVVAARRQFKPLVVYSRAAERGWLASAVRLISERINRCSPGREELACRTPEELPVCFLGAVLMPPVCSLVVAVPPIHEPDTFSLQPRLLMPVVPLQPSREPGLASTKTRRGREKLLNEVARFPGRLDQCPLKEREPLIKRVPSCLKRPIDESTAAILLVDIAELLMPVGLSGVARGVLRKRANANTSRSRSFPIIPSAASLSRRCEASVINGCACMVDIMLLASSGAALIQPTRPLGVARCAPPIPPLVALLWVKSHSHPGVGLVGRARCKPPDALGTSW